MLRKIMIFLLWMGMLIQIIIGNALGAMVALLLLLYFKLEDIDEKLSK